MYANFLNAIDFIFMLLIIMEILAVISHWLIGRTIEWKCIILKHV